MADIIDFRKACRDGSVEEVEKMLNNSISLRAVEIGLSVLLNKEYDDIPIDLVCYIIKMYVRVGSASIRYMRLYKLLTGSRYDDTIKKILMRIDSTIFRIQMTSYIISIDEFELFTWIWNNLNICQEYFNEMFLTAYRYKARCCLYWMFNKWQDDVISSTYIRHSILLSCCRTDMLGINLIKLMILLRLKLWDVSRTGDVYPNHFNIALEIQSYIEEVVRNCNRLVNVACDDLSDRIGFIHDNKKIAADGVLCTIRGL